MLISFIIGLTSSIAAVLITIAIQRYASWIRVKELRAIFDFLDREVTFVYPPRRDPYSDTKKVILPRTSTEDFLAMNNVVSAFLQIKWNGTVHFKNSRNFGGNDRDRDLIFICSPFSNEGTAEVLKALEEKHADLPHFMFDEKKKRFYISSRGGIFNSNTFDVVEECIENKLLPEEANMTDFAILIKAQNPWTPSKKVMVLAGIRGIGTWGVGECLKKGWKDIYEQKRSDGLHTKKGNFAAVVQVDFSKSDLVGFRVKDMIDLDG